MYETLKFEVKNNIGYVTISRPEALNALNHKVLEEIADCFINISQNKEIRVVILTGDGRSFVAGADIQEMSTLNKEEGLEFGQFGNKVMNLIETMPIPVIAAVNGFALGGGCELSMACDIRIASTKAKFGQPEVGLGITPGFGGTQRLPKLIGKGNAKLLIYTADIINAEEALNLGLVQKVVEPEELIKTCEELAQKLISKAPIAIQLAKEAINDGYTLDMYDGANLEAEKFSDCFNTLDQKEGMKAFLEKRPAEFKNK